MGVIEPHYHRDRVGRSGSLSRYRWNHAADVPCWVWFSLSDKGWRRRSHDSYAMRQFMGTSLRDHTPGPGRDAAPAIWRSAAWSARLLAEQGEIFTEQGWIMCRAGDHYATMSPPSPRRKNASGTRDPEMHQTKKGNQWYFGMKGHIGVDAGTGYVHSVTATAANVHDLDQVTHLVRPDDEVVYADAGYQESKAAGRRHERGPVRHRVEDRGPQGRVLRAMPSRTRPSPLPRPVCAPGRAPVPDRQARLRVHQDPVPRPRQNPNHLNMLFASANWLIRGRALALTG